MEDIELEEAEIAQTERIGLGDLVIVAVIAALTFMGARFWEFPGLYPGVWEDAAVASGVRPAANVVPGYWTAISTLIYKWCGIQSGALMLRLAGHAFLAGVAVCVYAVLREWLAFAMRMRPQLSKRRTLVMRLAASIGAVAFVATDPIWNAGQCLSETTILLGLTMGALESFFVFLRKGTIKYAYLCALILGILAAETPMGLFFPVVFISVYLFIVKVMPALESPLFKPSVMEVGKWHMTFIFLLALVAGIALNCWTFIQHNGVEAVGGAVGDIPVHYLTDYWHQLSTAGDAGAWIVWLGVGILPFVVTTIKFPESADEEQFLSYTSGLIFFFCGILVFAQSAFVPQLWFWTWFPMKSQYLLSIGLFCCAATLALSVTILGVDSLCRDHRRLARQVFGEIPEDEDEDEDEGARAVARKIEDEDDENKSVSTSFVRLFFALAIPVLMMAAMIYRRDNAVTREMLSVIDSAVREIVRESGSAKYLFTGGNLDAAIELEAARVDSPLKCYSLISGDSPLAHYLRLRGLEDEEDRFSFNFDTGMGLRTWIRDKPERLEEVSALWGFDLWRRDGKPLPPMGGFVSRPAGFISERERQRGIDAAHALIDRICKVLAMKGGVRACTDELVKHTFFTVQFRLARMCKYRADATDAMASREPDETRQLELIGEAEREAQLAKFLDDRNDICKSMIEAQDKRNATILKSLTPREGLQLALVRADFILGKVYAETILDADPSNPDANFSMGMYYKGEKQYARAERHLLRCLQFKPYEPAVYNNLAMMQIEQGRFEAAAVNIEKALARIPDSAEVLDTKKKLEEAIEAAKNPPDKKKPKKE